MSRFAAVKSRCRLIYTGIFFCYSDIFCKINKKIKICKKFFSKKVANIIFMCYNYSVNILNNGSIGLKYVLK